MLKKTRLSGAALAGAIAICAAPVFAQQGPDWQYPAVNGAGPVVPVPDATSKLPEGQT
ncbi:hypothetical protein [Microvirga roseola]|uniref:hypothetical protein n=1 Tax=Microvirga roseola TaxID=2883126 RepID=UPI001E337898|nr:hypothetical protein [Microvirga roseola]